MEGGRFSLFYIFKGRVERPRLLLSDMTQNKDLKKTLIFALKSFQLYFSFPRQPEAKSFLFRQWFVLIGFSLHFNFLW